VPAAALLSTARTRFPLVANMTAWPRTTIASLYMPMSMKTIVICGATLTIKRPSEFQFVITATKELEIACTRDQHAYA